MKALALAAVVAVAVTCSLVIGCGNAAAAELSLIASPGVRATLREIVPMFERSSGHKVVMQFTEIALIKLRIDAGESFDVIIPNPSAIDEFIKQGKVIPETRGVFGRTGLSIAVRKGLPKPDIGSVDALKSALLASRTVGYSKYGQTGINFLEVLDRLDISVAMRPKLRTFELLTEALEKGEVDLVVTGKGPILDAQLADYVGDFPPAIQRYVTFGIGVGATSKAPQVARDFLRFLASPDAATAYKAKGIERD
jgi:molybdate transport system substrate-binding protein